MLYAKYIIIIRIYWSEKGRNGGVQAQKTNIYYYLIIFKKFPNLRSQLVFKKLIFKKTLNIISKTQYQI